MSDNVPYTDLERLISTTATQVSHSTRLGAGQPLLFARESGHEYKQTVLPPNRYRSRAEVEDELDGYLIQRVAEARSSSALSSILEELLEDELCRALRAELKATNDDSGVFYSRRNYTGPNDDGRFRRLLEQMTMLRQAVEAVVAHVNARFQRSPERQGSEFLALYDSNPVEAILSAGMHPKMSEALIRYVMSELALEVLRASSHKEGLRGEHCLWLVEAAVDGLKGLLAFLTMAPENAEFANGLLLPHERLDLGQLRNDLVLAELGKELETAQGRVIGKSPHPEVADLDD